MKTLYIHRELQNVADITAWAKTQGFSTTINDLHVTVAFSRTPLLWESVVSDIDPQPALLTVPAGPFRSIKQFGRATVLAFQSVDLERRWKEVVDAGGSWDHDGYTPHVTITYEPGDVDLDAVEAGAVRVIMGHDRTDQNLQQKHSGDDEKILADLALAGS